MPIKEEYVHFFNLVSWPIKKYTTPNGNANMYTTNRNSFTFQEDTGKVVYLGYFSLNEILKKSVSSDEKNELAEEIKFSKFDISFLHSTGWSYESAK